MAKKAVAKTTKKAKSTSQSRLTDKDIIDAFNNITAVVRELSAKVDSLVDDGDHAEPEVEQPPVRRADGKIISGKQAQQVKAPVQTPVKATVDNIKARYELWAYDEYDQGSIVTSGPNLDKIMDAGKKYVTEANVDNALAAGEKDKSWEAYFPQVFVDGQPTYDVLYGGNKKNGQHHVYVRGDGKWELRRPDSTVEFRFYLGATSNGRAKSDWYAQDFRGKVTTRLGDQSLERKTVLFVKVI